MAGLLTLGFGTRAESPSLDTDSRGFTTQAGGKTYRFRNGDLYELDGNREAFVKNIFPPDVLRKRYAAEGGRVFRVAETGEKYPVLEKFQEGFENAPSLVGLIGPKRGWSAFTLQSPRAPEVSDYVALRNRMMKGDDRFLDNRLEPSAARAHSGRSSLYALAVAPKRGMVTSKASLETGLAYFKRGDDFWFSGWFYILGPYPLGVMDLECTYIEHAPGPRLLIDEKGEPRVELKWADKPTYRASQPAVVPRNQWVHLKVHFKLHEGSLGRSEVWVDGEKVIDGRGPTLPLPDVVLDSLEVGITASHPHSASELFVDDLQFSRAP